MRLSLPATLTFLVIELFPSAIAQTPTFRAASKEVRIDILVANQGKPVTGLKVADFEVLDNGVRQEINYMSFKQIPISAILVLDLSSSMAGENLANLKDASRALVKGLREYERAALVTFGHAVKLSSPLTTELESVNEALDRAEPFGDTSVIDASYAGLTLAESAVDRPLLIVFSDGLDTLSWLTSEDVLETAKQAEIVVYAISAGRLLNNTFLRNLTQLTGGSLFEVESTENLKSVLVGILEEFRNRYFLTYIPQGVTNSGWHTIKVRVKGSHDRVMYRPGYISDPASVE